jgi:hypothetical protein
MTMKGVPTLLVVVRVLDRVQTTTTMMILMMLTILEIDMIDDGRRSIKERKVKEVVVDIIDVVAAALVVAHLTDPVTEKRGRSIRRRSIIAVVKKDGDAIVARGIIMSKRRGRENTAMVIVIIRQTRHHLCQRMNVTSLRTLLQSNQALPTRLLVEEPPSLGNMGSLIPPIYTPIHE